MQGESGTLVRAPVEGQLIENRPRQKSADYGEDTHMMI